jgi:hypothetical protein
MYNLQCFISPTVIWSSTLHTKRIVAFPLQGLLRERVTVLRYTFIAYLVSESVMAWLTLKCLIPVGWKRRTNPVQFGTLEIHCAH